MIQFKRLFSNSNPPGNRLQKINIYITIISAIGSVILATWSIVLTIYYRNSIQKVEDLDKVIIELKKQNELQQNQISKLTDIAFKNNEVYKELLDLNEGNNLQNDLISNNSKPLIKDVEYSFKKLESYSQKIEFNLLIKNYGYRAAYNFNLKCIFLKFNDSLTRILSHGTLKFEKDKIYQETVFSNETKTYKTISNFSDKGFSDLNTLLVVIKYSFFDSLPRKNEYGVYYYSNAYDAKEDKLTISTATEDIKALAIQYLKEKKL